ncbi:hypothetical protein HDU76_007792, partial [Blyttiomyces sp. JEL0837]
MNPNPGSPDRNTRLPPISARPERDASAGENNSTLTMNGMGNTIISNHMEDVAENETNDNIAINEPTVPNITTINEPTLSPTYTKKSIRSSSTTETRTTVSTNHYRSKPAGTPSDRSFSAFSISSGTTNNATNAVLKQFQTGVNAVLVRKRTLGSSSPSHFLETLLAVPRNWFTLRFKDRDLERRYQTYANEILEMRQARLYAAAFIFSIGFPLA